MASYYSGYSNYYRLRLDVTQGTQSIANNTTSVSWALYLETTTAYFELHSISGTYVNINGSRAWTAGTNQISLPGYNSTTKLASGTKTVTHNSNGTKTVPLYVYYTMPDSASYLPGNMSISASMTLSTIARVSTPTLNKSTIEAGTTVRITTNRLNSAFKHILYWRINGGSGWTTIATGVENFHDWTPAITSTCNALPNATSGVFNIMVETYNGSAFVGYKIINITITIPANIVPSISAPVVTETNSKIKSTLGYTGFVSGISTYSVLSSTRTAGQGATVRHIQYKLGTYSYKYPPTLTTARAFGTMTGTSIVVYAFIVDSRGRKATSSTTITQTTYNAPTISSLTASRYNPKDKTQVQIALKATQTKLSNKNTMRYKLEYKKSTETAWKQLKAYSAYQVADINTGVSQTIPNDAKYNIRVTVQDLIGVETSSIITLINTEKKWLQVTDGEDIDVIGNLMNNGSQVLTQSLVRELRVPFTKGAAILTPAQVGVTTPLNYHWFITPNYESHTGIMFGVPQGRPNSLNIYLRTQTGTAPPNGEYSVNIIGVPKS